MSETEKQKTVIIKINTPRYIKAAVWYTSSLIQVTGLCYTESPIVDAESLIDLMNNFFLPILPNLASDTNFRNMIPGHIIV